MTRVLVIGTTGMLGHKLYQVLGAEPSIELHGTCRVVHPVVAAMPGTLHAGIEIRAGSSALRELLVRLKPDIVVNAAGAIKQKDLYAAIDDNFYLNGSLPHLLPLLNPNHSARVIHFSTDCVYKGDRGGYRESEPADAEDLYGRSKAVGEIDYGKHLTLRTSIVGFELHGHLSLLGWLMQQSRGATLRGYTRAIYSGLPTVHLSEVVRDLIVQGFTIRGLYHVASEPIAKINLLRQLSSALGLDHSFLEDSSVVIDRSLNDTRFRGATGTMRPGWERLVAELSADLRTLPYPHSSTATPPLPTRR